MYHVPMGKMMMVSIRIMVMMTAEVLMRLKNLILIMNPIPVKKVMVRRRMMLMMVMRRQWRCCRN